LKASSTKPQGYRAAARLCVFARCRPAGGHKTLGELTGASEFLSGLLEP
jgi:hypothetical protein